MATWHRTAALEEIAEALPDIIRGLIHRRPVQSGDWEITLAQARALGTIGDHQECTMSELARALGISMSAATGLVDRLVGESLVERDADPNDRRLVLLRLAAAGQRARSAFRREKRRHMEAALRHLSDEELAEIARGLSLLQAALGRTQEEARSSGD